VTVPEAFTSILGILMNCASWVVVCTDSPSKLYSVTVKRFTKRVIKNESGFDKSKSNIYKIKNLAEIYNKMNLKLKMTNVK